MTKNTHSMPSRGLASFNASFSSPSFHGSTAAWTAQSVSAPPSISAHSAAPRSRSKTSRKALRSSQSHICKPVGYAISKTRLKKATHQRSIKPRNIRVRSPAIQEDPPRPHHLESDGRCMSGAAAGGGAGAGPSLIYSPAPIFGISHMTPPNRRFPEERASDSPIYS